MTASHLPPLTVAAEAVAAEVTGRTDPIVQPLGSGTDHAVYLLDRRWVLRQRLIPGDESAEAIIREHQLLAAIAAVCPVPVPRPAASAPDAGVLVVEYLGGTPLIDAPTLIVDRLEPALNGVVRALAGVPWTIVEPFVDVDDTPLDVYRNEVGDLAHRVARFLDSRQRELLDRFLDAEMPEEPADTDRMLCHNDLGAEHILVDDTGDVCGLIDWSDAAWADPARDLGRIARDLGAGTAERIARAVRPDDFGLVARLQFHARCALIEDLAHALDSGDLRYRDTALAAFDRTFTTAPPPAT